MVREHFTGAQGHFVMSRLQLKSGLNFLQLPSDDADPEKAQRLERAILEICPEVLEQRSSN